MKAFKNHLLPALLLILFSIPEIGSAQNLSPQPWSESQVMEPSQLAKEIKAGAATDILILNIGSVNDIKGAVTIGPVEDQKNLEKLKEYLQDVSKDQAIVLYCGCCPMKFCPNIRPAFKELEKEGFTNFKILNLKKNIYSGWISKGYPLADDSK